MKLKSFAITIGSVVAAAAVASAVAVVVDKYYGEKIAKKNYVSCGTDGLETNEEE